VSSSTPGTSSLVRRATAHARQHGVLSLLRTAFRRYVFNSRAIYVFMCPHDLTTEGVDKPLVANFRASFVASNDEADELARDYDDFRLFDKRARPALDEGAVALCQYSGRSVVNVAWLATDQPAHAAIDSTGLPFDVATHRAWTGRVNTAPAYEGRGLFRYACARRFEYLLSLGIDESCTCVAEGNARSHVMTASLGCRLVGKGHLVRLLWRTWWHTGTLARADEEAIREAVASARANRRTS